MTDKEHIAATLGELTGIVNQHDPDMLDDLVKAIKGDTEDLAVKLAERHSACFRALVYLDKLKR